MSEKDAESKLLNDILGCEVLQLLTVVANYKLTAEHEKKEFIAKYLQPCYYNVEWIKSEVDEKYQDKKIGSKIYRI